MTDLGEQRPVNAAAQRRFAALENTRMRVVAPDLGFFSGARSSLGDIWAHRSLCWLLAKRELKARYKDSVLGYVWTLIRPLINLLIYYFAIGQILGAARAIDNFAVYVFAGLTAWNLFSLIITSSTGSIVGNSGIVKKVYLPREIFPLASAIASFIDFLSQLAILVIGTAFIVGAFDLPSFVLYWPLSLMVIIVWGVGLGLFLAAANVYLRDIQYLVEVGMMIGFWLTPSVYSFQMVVGSAPAWLTDLYLMNPLTLAVMGFQKSFWAPGSDPVVWPGHMLTRLGIMFLIGLILVFVAQRYFARMQRNFAQEL